MRKTSFLLAALLAFSSMAALARPKASELSPRDIYKHYAPGVVLLMAVGSDGTGELGTGSVVDDTHGRILTNAHVVVRKSTRRPYETIRVYFKPERVTGDPKRDLKNPYTGRVVAFDLALDLAVVELDAKPRSLTPIPIGDADGVEPGESVVAIGHPEQGGLWTLTTGVVSTVKSDLGGIAGKDVFQTDAGINRGNSGGPLIDMNGSMIGVNTSMARKAQDGLTITSVNFAVKSSVVKNWLAKAPVEVDYYRTNAENPSPAPDEPMTPPKTPRVFIDPNETLKSSPMSEPPRESEKTGVLPGKPKAKTTPKARILTPKKPFKIQALIEREIAAMEDLGSEMKGEIDKRRGRFKKGG